MENLTKQQIVLLTLLVSFMTSIATGIVTVSLVNQAPPNTTNTIERVIENTVASALPSGNTAAVGNLTPSTNSGSLVAAINNVSKSIVKIHEYGKQDSVSGLGVVINDRGAIMTDKSVIAGLVENAATYPDGREYRLTIIQSQINGDLVFLGPVISANQFSSTSPASTASFVPADIGTFPKLGETIASLGGTDGGTLGVGVVDQIITTGASSTPTAISTTIDPSKTLTGSPLFDISGTVVGIQTSFLSSNLSSKSGTEFYPIAPIKAAFPK
jgi:S1-C subfamily serine protease